MLSTQKIAEYKSRLEADRKKLLAEIEEESATPDFGADTDHFEEESDEAEELGNQLAIAQTHRDRVAQIDAALSRIVTGEYGLCVNCNREISEKVLDIVPESDLCQECKQNM